MNSVLLVVALVVAPAQEFQERFQVNKSSLKTTGDNPYFPLRPGYKLHLRGGNTTLIVTVTKRTERVDGVLCRVVEERETEGGKLKEISLNFFAHEPSTGNVYYFGEDVDNYKNGKIVNHDSAWRSGVKGATFGMFMPGDPKVGDKYYQELAPDVALDRFEIVSLSAEVTTPAGRFKASLKAKETTPLEPGVSDYKYYVRGIGMVQDGDLKLASVSK